MRLTREAERRGEGEGIERRLTRCTNSLAGNPLPPATYTAVSSTSAHSSNPQYAHSTHTHTYTVHSTQYLSQCGCCCLCDATLASVTVGLRLGLSHSVSLLFAYV